MHPFERLRYVARAAGASPALVATEAADSLAALAERPETLVTASRRLLEFHPANGALWWVCARVLAADDTVAAAHAAAAELEEDLTPLELANAIDGLGESPAIVVLSAGETVVGGLASCSSCSVRAVAPAGELGRMLHGLGQAVDEVTAYTPEELEQAVDGAAVLVLEGLAASTSGALVATGAYDDPGPEALIDRVLEVAASSGIPLWLVAGVGRVLPEQLFEALVAQLDERPGPPRLVPRDALGAVVGVCGLEEASLALRRVSCAVPPELLRRAR